MHLTELILISTQVGTEASWDGVDGGSTTSADIVMAVDRLVLGYLSCLSEARIGKISIVNVISRLHSFLLLQASIRFINMHIVCSISCP